MKRSEMTCVNCIKFSGIACRLNPVPLTFLNKPPTPSTYMSAEDAGITTRESRWFLLGKPKNHWCAQGEWHPIEPDHYGRPVERSYSWGDWDDEEEPDLKINPKVRVTQEHESGLVPVMSHEKIEELRALLTIGSHGIDLGSLEAAVDRINDALALLPEKAEP